ncbi:MAG: DUF5618 family protein [Planctomycetota bacterium]|nr:DUF5618 family protein [Planctomycetota bacterium]MDI6788410.1 DUF5618 family protein [Planctomycetota bacterium]
MKESLRYLHNAREILKKAPREGHIYTDLKPVRESCATAYLAILEAIDEYLLSRGLTPKELPKSVDGYQKALRKFLAVHNGKLFREFDSLYHALHIAGYYRKDLRDAEALRYYFHAAQQFIEKITK